MPGTMIGNWQTSISVNSANHHEEDTIITLFERVGMCSSENNSWTHQRLFSAGASDDAL